MWFIIILFFLLTAYCSLLLYYRVKWDSIAIAEENLLRTKCNTYLSVIVPARNESKNIAACLKSLLGQTYNSTHYEIIIVDDCSTDDTAAIAKRFLRENVHLISLPDVINNEHINAYKKKALETGISNARGELIVCTDADCIAPIHWLQTISAFYETSKAEFIASPVKYMLPVRSISWPEKLFYFFQSIDFTSLQGIGGAATAAGFHNMCNGANLAFKKESFDTLGGYKGINEIASGDDMLLMEKFSDAFPGKVKFLKAQNAMVKTLPPGTLSDFLQQRIRWASKAGKYKNSVTKIVLSLVFVTNTFLLLLAFWSFFDVHFLVYLLIFLFAKTLAELWFLRSVTKFFNNQNILKWFLPAVPFHIFYTVLAGVLGMFGKYNWKGRRVK